MRLFAIGDLQGCLQPLQKLLDQVRFEPRSDHLWFCGDLVNRGPQSLETLRYVSRLGKNVTAVLGNHDLHLLAVAAGVTPLRKKDTLLPILEADDRDELINWLRHCPLAHYQHGLVLLHAGVAPQWSVTQVLDLAGEVETALRGDHYADLLADMYGNQPDRWDDALQGFTRLRCIINYLTRARYCTSDGALDLRHKGTPGSQPPELTPWFRLPDRKTATTPIIFGHWSTLGIVDDLNVVPLDSGCVWGNALTAYRLLPRGGRFSVPCEASRAPG